MFAEIGGAGAGAGLCPAVVPSQLSVSRGAEEAVTTSWPQEPPSQHPQNEEGIPCSPTAPPARLGPALLLGIPWRTRWVLGGLGCPKSRSCFPGCVTARVWGAQFLPLPQDSQGSRESSQPHGCSHTLEGKGVPLGWGGSGPSLVEGEVSGYDLDPRDRFLPCCALDS